MRLTKDFKKKIFTGGASGCLAVVLASCSTMVEQQSQHNQVAPNAAMAPVQMQIPGDQQLLPQNIDFEGLVEMQVVAADVSQPKAFYVSEGGNQDYVTPAFEIPKPAKKKNYGRGKGVPVPSVESSVSSQQSAQSYTAEIPTPSSWTGTTAAFLAGDFDDNVTQNGSVFIPPDIHAAAGPDHVVNVVNTFIEFYSKDGTQVFIDSLEDFFAPLTPANATFDPKVIYDQYAQRWLVVTMERVDEFDPITMMQVETSRILLAVSDDSNPTGTWYTTAIDSKVDISSVDRWADYPGFAVDEEAIYITANMFGFASGAGAFGGVRLWIIDKGEMAGFYNNMAASVAIFDPYSSGGNLVTTQPAHVFGTPSAAAAGTYLVAYSGISSGVDEAVQTVRVDNPLAMAPVFTLSFVAAGDIDSNAGSLPSAVQPGTGTTVETNDRRALNAVWRNDELWLAATVTPSAGADMGQTTAHWWRINADGAAVPTLADQGNIGGEGLDAINPVATFFPSIAVNSKGEAAIGFSASSLGIFPGAYFATREAGDAAGTVSASQTVQAGNDFYIRTFGGTNRWGDYSGSAVDPIDECLWIYNQYADTQGTPTPETGRWATAYAKTCACEQSKVLTGGAWNLFGVACFPAQQTPATLFPTLTPGDYQSTWVVQKRSGASYVVVAIDEVLEPGVGYWFFSVGANVTLDVEGAINEVTDVPLVMAAGFENMVSNPHGSSVDSFDLMIVDGMTAESFADAVSGGQVNNTMHVYDSGANDYVVFAGSGLPANERTLTPGDGFWVQGLMASQAIRVPIPAGGMAPVSNQPDALRNKKKVNKADKYKSWIVRVVIESGDRVSRAHLFGQDATSEDGADLNDLKQLAPFSDSFFRVSFPKKKWGDKSGDYATDIRSVTKKPKGKWPVVIKASDSSELVTLRLEGPEDILAKIKIKDKKAGRKPIDFKNGYTFSMDGAEERHFIIKVK